MRNPESLSDYELMDVFLQENNPDARVAFKIFHGRHASFMYNIAMKLAYERFGGQIKQSAEDICGTAIEKFLKNVSKFRKEPGLSPEKQKKHVRTWLYRIVENAFKDYLKRFYSETSVINTEAEEMEGSEFADTKELRTKILSPLAKDRLKIILTEVEKLSQREQDVLRHYSRYGKFDEKGKWVLPSDILRDLSAKYQVEPNTIQKIKQRIIQKIKERTSNK